MPAHKKPKLKIHIKSGIIKAALFGRRFTVCCLGTLPTLRKSVLMDIDTDFLVIDSIRNASNTQQIAKRRPWISPKELANILKKKIKKPKVITVSYSVNGGWTPMRYKYLGDEIARYMGDKDPGISKRLKAAERFNVFLSSSDKKYYRQAIELNPLYRREDNNYGTLYLAKKKFALARKEFLKILNVDPQNPGSLLGMGSIALKKSGLDDAKRYFRRSLRYSKGRLLSRVYNKAMLGLAEAEFRLGNFKTARKLLTRHQKLQPFTPTSYLLLARIFEKERNFNKAADYYKDSINLGALSPVPLARLLKISKYIKARDRIAEYVKKKRRLLKNMGMTGRR